MSWKIETPVRVGPLVLSAIAEVDVSISSRGSGMVGVGKKVPALILQELAGEITAIDITGEFYESEEIELLFPKAVAQFKTLLSETV